MIISFIYYVALSKFVDSSFPQCNVHKGVQGRCLTFTSLDGYLKLWELKETYIHMICETCHTYETNQHSRTKSWCRHEPTRRLWENIGCELNSEQFMLDDLDYMITTDYYSNFFEIDKLKRTDSKTLIYKKK